MMGARPLALSAAFVLEEGFPIESLEGDRGGHGRGRGRGRGSRSSPATPRWSITAPPTACTSPPPASAAFRPAATCRRPRVADGDVVICSGSIGDHGMAVLLARGDLALEAEIVSDTAPAVRPGDPPARPRRLRPDGCATPPAAGSGRSATSWPARRNLTVVLDEAALPGQAGGRRRRASCSASTRFTSPTRGSSSPSWRPKSATPPWRPSDPQPLGRDAAVIGQVRGDPPGLVVLVTAFGGTRIVDMLVGDPLPRIC